MAKKANMNAAMTGKGREEDLEDDTAGADVGVVGDGDEDGDEVGVVGDGLAVTVVEVVLAAVGGATLGFVALVAPVLVEEACVG
jgi:hypothetical protein